VQDEKKIQEQKLEAQGKNLRVKFERKIEKKKSCYYFTKEHCSMSRNIFRSLQGLLRSWKSAVRKSAMQ
jgi:hypothetical protein